MYDIAVIIVNYNMPEMTDKIVNHINRHMLWPHDLFVVDNGSDSAPPSKHSNVFIDENVQTTGGWLAGLRAASFRNTKYFAYWLIATSAEFIGTGDALTPLALKLVKDKNAVIVHPVLTPDSDTAWGYMKAQGGDQPRQVHHTDHIAMLVRADWFNGIGRLDPSLYLAHGTCLETCYKARRDGRSIWMHEGATIRKHQDIGYTMNRMGMTAEERRQAARLNMDDVLIPRYGPDYWQRLQNEYRVTA